MTYEEQLRMLEDFMTWSDDVVDSIPQWYVEWWTKTHKEEKDGNN